MIETNPWRPVAVRLGRDEGNWRARAVCGPGHTDDWPLFVGPLSRGERERLVKEHCHHCPVVAQCRDWADSEFHFRGVAGGRIYSPDGHSANRATATNVRED